MLPDLDLDLARKTKDDRRLLSSVVWLAQDLVEDEEKEMRWNDEEVSVLDHELTVNLWGDVGEDCTDHDPQDTAGGADGADGADGGGGTLNVAMVGLTFFKSVLCPLSVIMKGLNVFINWKLFVFTFRYSSVSV